MTTLDELEQRVSTKFAAALAERVLPFDTSAWLDEDMSITIDFKKIPPGTPQFQFPREQWISYPNRRAVVLTILDRLLDVEVPDERQPRLVIDDQVEVEVGQPDAHHVFVGFEFGPQLRVGVGPQVGALHQLQQALDQSLIALAGTGKEIGRAHV